MATYSGGGRTREPGEMWNMQLFTTTSLDDSGYVLKTVEQSNFSKVDKCGATDIPYCVNYRSSRDPHDMNAPNTLFKTGTQLGEMGLAVFREGWAKLKLATNHSALEKGDPVVVAASGGGKVDKYTAATMSVSSVAALGAAVELRFDQLSRIVGHVEGANVAVGTTSGPSQDKVLVKLSIRAIGIIT